MKLNPWQEMVREFHEKFSQPIGFGKHIEALPVHRAILRASLTLEECCEKICKGLLAGNVVQIIDGACDLQYVVNGTMVEMGVDLDPFYREVHRTNMAKEGGPTRSDGKILKPPGWQAPRIADMVQEHNAKIERKEARTHALRVFGDK